MSMDELVLCEIENGIAQITINRPKALNALNGDVLKGLDIVLNDIIKNPDVKVVILTGAGEKAFVAGADIASMSNMTSAGAVSFSEYGQMVFNKIEGLRQVTIAAIDGYALGGGCELALACDIRVASPKSKMGLPEVSLGVIPGFGGTQRLLRLVGTGIAIEMLVTAKTVTAEEGFRIGLINHVTESGEVMAYSRVIAETISSNSTTAIALGKKAIYEGAEMDIDRGFTHETALFGLCFSTADQKEGMEAFLEKRKAKFV